MEIDAYMALIGKDLGGKKAHHRAAKAFWNTEEKWWHGETMKSYSSEIPWPAYV